jgi:poly(3-hydroxybutyrate) depolymerase
MMIDDVEREYKVELPENYSSDVPYRLIFAWHAMGGNIQQMENGGYYGQRFRWDNTAIFVAGQGLKIATVTGWSNLGDRDVDFARKLAETIISNYCIDKERIFSIGMSYGGIMSNTVGCSLGDIFRAIAPMSGGGPSAMFGSSECTGKVAAWISHGKDDTNIPWVTFTDGQASRDHWIQANHCSEETADILPGPCVAYQRCDEGYPVHWCAFEGKHQIPRFAANAIWTFLSQF